MTQTMLITGAGSGIGRGLAGMAARDGWRVLVTDAKSPAADQVATELASDGLDVRSAGLDVTNEEAVVQFIDSNRSPGVDVLINNAGLQYVAGLEQFPQPQWERLIDVMLNGACIMTRAVLPTMRKRGYGRIINIGSIHSLVASPYKSAYVAAKHGLLGFSKVIALETASTDITVNTICPSYVRTPLVEQQVAAQAREHGISEAEVIDRIMLAPMPKQAFITIEEIYGTVRFLASDIARNITGQEIVIDGGWTIR